MALTIQPQPHFKPTIHSLSSPYTTSDNGEYLSDGDIINQAMYKNIDPLLETISNIKSLQSWPAGWNGYDVVAPKSESINYAVNLISHIYKDVISSSIGYKDAISSSKGYKDAISSSKGWREPHVTATEDGDIMMEWWNGEKGLTFYISDHQISYIKDWGADILNEMEDGPANTSEERSSLWTWLNS